MAKKKKNVKAPVKNAVKAGALKVNEVPEGSKKKGSGGMILMIAVIIIAITAFESVMIINKDKQMNKKPVLVTSWKAIYRSVVCSVVYNNDYISVDSQSNQIQVQDKMSGQVKGIFEAKSGEPIWAAETKDGVIYAVLKNSNALWVIKNYKKTAEYALNDVKSASGIVADSKNVLYVSDGATGKIYKYSTEGVKLGEFAGIGDGKDKIQGSIGKIFIDAKDNVYALTGGAYCGVKAFTSDGKFLVEFKLPSPEACQLANIAPTPDGNIYINYFNGSDIIVYNSKGKLIGTFSKDITGNFAITSPGTIAGGADGYVYVGTYAVAVFSPIKY